MANLKKRVITAKELVAMAVDSGNQELAKRLIGLDNTIVLKPISLKRRYFSDHNERFIKPKETNFGDAKDGDIPHHQNAK